MFFKNKQEVTDPTTKKKKSRHEAEDPSGYRRGIDPKKGIGICSD